MNEACYMKNIFYLFLFLLFISSLAIPVLSDGIPLSLISFILPKASQEAQIAIIDWKNGEYTLSLFITADLSSYSGNNFLWIIPLEETPLEIKVEEINQENFKEEIEDLNKKIKEAREINNQIREIIRVYYGGLYSFYIPLFPGLFLSFRPFALYASGDKEGITLPETTFKFGKLGRAEIYDTRNLDLETFFKSMGYPLPTNLSQYKNKKIAVFNLTKTSDKLSIKVNFRFKGSKIFYPSGTTQFWQEKPREFHIYIKLPSNYELVSNIEPNFYTRDVGNCYYVFSSNELIGEKIGYSREYEFYKETGIFPERKELYTEDIKANVVYRPIPLILFIYSIFFPVFGIATWIFLIVLTTFLTWFVVLFFFFKFLKKTKVEITKIILSCITIPLVLLFMNNGFLFFSFIAIFHPLLFFILLGIQVVFFFMVLFSILGVKSLYPIKRLILTLIPLRISLEEAFGLIFAAFFVSILFSFILFLF